MERMASVKETGGGRLLLREKALGEREEKREAAKRARDAARKEQKRIEILVKETLESAKNNAFAGKEKGHEGRGTFSSKLEDVASQRAKSETNEAVNKEEQDIVRKVAETARLEQKLEFIEKESEVECLIREEKEERATRGLEKVRKRTLRELQRHVQETRERMENESFAHERFIKNMNAEAEFWSSESEIRHEKRARDFETAKEMLENVERDVIKRKEALEK